MSNTRSNVVDKIQHSTVDLSFALTMKAESTWVTFLLYYVYLQLEHVFQSVFLLSLIVEAVYTCVTPRHKLKKYTYLNFTQVPATVQDMKKKEYIHIYIYSTFRLKHHSSAKGVAFSVQAQNLSPPSRWTAVLKPYSRWGCFTVDSDWHRWRTATFWQDV